MEILRASTFIKCNFHDGRPKIKKISKNVSESEKKNHENGNHLGL